MAGLGFRLSPANGAVTVNQAAVVQNPIVTAFSAQSLGGRPRSLASFSITRVLDGNSLGTCTPTGTAQTAIDAVNP